MHRFGRYVGGLGISLSGMAGAWLIAPSPLVSDRETRRFITPPALVNSSERRPFSASSRLLKTAQSVRSRQQVQAQARAKAQSPAQSADRASTPRPRRTASPSPQLQPVQPTVAAKSQPTVQPSMRPNTRPNTRPTGRPAQARASQSSLGPHLVIDLSQRQVSLYRGQGQGKHYPIAIGRAGWETPTGQFRIMDLRQNPTWINPFTGKSVPPDDPQNPLGGYWIGFWTDGHNWIGFHGTPQVDSVGTASSHGCLRMYPQDIAELFTEVSLGMPVIVQP
jgi:lipoprotein-anchoring transpeptidase ErfK/SrfK